MEVLGIVMNGHQNNTRAIKYQLREKTAIGLTEGERIWTESNIFLLGKKKLNASLATDCYKYSCIHKVMVCGGSLHVYLCIHELILSSLYCNGFAVQRNSELALASQPLQY